MVLYFSGTGNSRYAAQIIGKIADDKIVSMNALIKSRGAGALPSDRPFVFVAPVHAWRLPKIVEDFIRKTEFVGSDQAYFVMTCGDSMGNAVHYLKRLCAEKGFSFLGTASIVMPENYVAMFDVPDQAEAAAIIKQAEPKILATAERIRNGQPLPEETVTAIGRFQSAVINPVFRSVFIRAKGFHINDACTGCGTCAELCPTNNIRLSGGKPVWGENCTHCMACICGCPCEAVEYKNKSKGKPRYYNKKEPVI